MVLYIQKKLDFFDFGVSMKRWVTLFYNNIKSYVLINGQVYQLFRILRGCRQGDPLSPYTFISCAKILALMSRKNSKIKGIVIQGKEYLNSQYADDTSFTFDESENVLQDVILTLKFYAEASGLCVNMDKTKIIWFENMKK